MPIIRHESGAQGRERLDGEDTVTMLPGWVWRPGARLKFSQLQKTAWRCAFWDRRMWGRGRAVARACRVRSVGDRRLSPPPLFRYQASTLHQLCCGFQCPFGQCCTW